MINKTSTGRAMRKRVFEHMRTAKPRSVCASTQADQGFCCPLTEPLNTKDVSVESHCTDNTLRMRGIILNLCISYMLEDTFSLGAVNI